MDADTLYDLPDLDLYGEGHEACTGEFCLATRRPGLCKGTHRTGTTAKPTPPVPVPAAPAAKTETQAESEAAKSATYQRAIVHAQALAQALGVHKGARAVGDYTQALHAHYRAVTAADRARATAQLKHDNAVKRNAAIAAHQQALTHVTKTKTTVATARQAMVRQSANSAIAQRLAQTRAAAQLAAVGDDTTYALYAMPRPADAGVYALASFEHQACQDAQFCRNPLHPGPCKGWKHALHAVAPGVFHAHEQARVDRLNEQRLKKVDALKALGKPVPAHLLKPHTYSVPKAAPAAPTPNVSPVAPISMHVPKVQKALDVAHGKIAAGSVPAEIDLYKGISDEQFQGLSATDQDAILKALGDIAHSTPTSQAGMNAKALHARFSKTLEKPTGPTPAAPLPPMASAKVKYASAVANGSAPGAKYAKVQLAAYGQVSKAEFDALPPETQQKILSDLTAAHGKFLDPKSKAEAAHVLTKLGGDVPKAEAPKEGAKPVAHELAKAKPAGAKGYNDDQVQAIKAAHNQTDPKLALKAILRLSHADYDAMTPEDRNTVKLRIAHLTGHTGETGKQALIAHQLLTGALKPVDTGPNEHGHNLGEQVAAHLGVQVGQKPQKVSEPLAHPHMMHAHGLAKTDASAEQKLAAFEAPGVSKAEYDKLGSQGKNTVDDALAELHSTGTPAQAKRAKDIGAKLGIDPAHFAAPAKSEPKAKPPVDVAKKYIEGHLSSTEDNEAGLHDALKANLSKTAYDALSSDEKATINQAISKAKAASIGTPEFDKLDALESKFLGIEHEPVSPATGASSAQVKQALNFAKSHHTGAIDAATDDQAAQLAVGAYGKLSKADFDGLPAEQQKSILDSIAKFNPDNTSTSDLKDLAAAKAKLTGVAAETPTSPPKAGGKPVKLDHAAKVDLLGAFKMQPKGSQLKDPTHLAYDNVLAIAHAYSGRPGFGALSIRQVLQAVDEEHAHNLGVTNQGLLEKKVTDWLATAEGKAYAAAAKPDPAVVKALGGNLELPAGVTLKTGQKAQTLAGPGGYSAKLKTADFKPHTPEEAQAVQDAAMKQTGAPWTPDQRQALQSYTSASGSMNNYLRGQTTHADPLTKQRIIDAQAAMRPLTANHLLRRGTGWEQLPEGFRTPEGAAKLVGKTLQDPAFLSTSVGASGAHFGGPLLLEIEAPVGTHAAFVKSISRFPTEDEMLLAAGSKMKVLDVRQEGGKTVMRVRVVTPK